MEAVQADLRKSLDQSLERMEQVISRIQRFTNLDRSETQAVDLNELLSDVVALMDAPSVEVLLALEELRPVLCHRQSLSTAFSWFASLCDGRPASKIRIAGRSRSPLTPTETSWRFGSGTTVVGCRPRNWRVFSIRGFQIAEGRISAGNWSLFTARQVVQEQGGEIRVSSEPGKGTAFVVSLPSKWPAESDDS